MKKLLAVLGSLAVVGSSATVVAFEYSNTVKSSIEAKIRNYINVSSLLARGTILSQKSINDQGQATDGKYFSLKYSSKYLYSKQMNHFFNDSAFRGNGSKSVRSFLGTMLNIPDSKSFVYTVKDDAFVDASPTLALQNDIDTGKKGENQTIQTLSLVTGLLSIVFGNDFSSASSGGFIENTLKAAEGVLGDFVKNGGLVTMRNILFDVEHQKTVFEKVAASFSEDDLTTHFSNREITDLNFDEVFKFRQIEFWQGLAEILYSKNHGADDLQTWDKWMIAIANAKDGDYASVAFNKDEKIAFELNKISLDGITKVLRYLRTLFVYIQSFAEIGLPISEIQDDNHLFSPEKSNGIFVRDQLKSGKYINLANVVQDAQDQPTKPAVVQWAYMNGNYYQVLNFQNIIQFFQNLFSVDPKTDPNGYGLERTMAILFQQPLKADEKKPSSADDSYTNPVFDLILQPLAVQLIKIFAPNLSDIANFLPMISPLLRASLTYNNSFWEPVAGHKILAPNFLVVLSLAATIISDATTKNILNDLVKEITLEKDHNPPVPKDKQTFGSPFKALFNGDLLSKIFAILKNNKVAIAPKIETVFKNVTTLLNSNINDLLSSFGLDIATMPIFLYGLKNKTLNEIIDTVAQQFEVQRDKKLKENQSFLFNLGSINKLVVSLGQKVKIAFKGDVPKKVEEANILVKDGDYWSTDLISGILISFTYDNEIKDLAVNYGASEELWSANKSTSKPSFLFGNREKDLVYTFAPGSLFSAIEQLYGHNNTDEPKAIQQINKLTMRQLILESVKLIGWMKDVSIPLYVEDTFDPYFDSKNWTTKLLDYANLANPGDDGFIKYLLYYKNLDTKLVKTYEVLITRSAWDGENTNWNKMGTWKVASINLLPI